MEASHRTKGLLRLTMACNERCPFCNVPVEDYATPTPREEATLAEIDAFVASGEQTLTISGGEPTLLRKRLLRVVREARARGVPFVELQTNAVLVDAAYAKELAVAGLTSAFVSLLGINAEDHDALAGLDGAFPRCLAGIDAMLDAGIPVTLNPVIARRTQGRVAEYVRFVAERLPRVRSISLSAVQPHGRARKNTELLPDYDVLAASVRQARKVAASAGISLLNPYCGLPRCVGWEDGQGCVEANEAADGGWRQTPGIENRGDKVHGAPCRRCALRPGCGGAWKAYWEVREGRGLRAPAMLIEPWEGEGPAQTTVRGFGADPGPALAAATTPTVWLWTDRFTPADSGLAFTHLAVEWKASQIGVESLRALRAARPRPVFVGLRVGGDPVDLGAIFHVLQAVGAVGVTLLGPPQWAPMELALRDAFPRLMVRRVG
jgi:MoaA/NifB/PqqE/SkfB family radical SAM enzyme